MKIFAIRDNSVSAQKNLAYLFYYEGADRFYIEIPDEADPWEVPMILDTFVKKGQYTVDFHWSRTWVQQRIVPSDRQNLGQILKDNGLKEYSEYQLLLLAMGRCAQDDCYLVPVAEEEVPASIRKREQRRVEDVVPLPDFELLVFFRNGDVKRCDMKPYFEKERPFRILLERDDYFSSVRVQPGGYGVEWDVNLNISDKVLQRMKKNGALRRAEFYYFALRNVINTAEAAELLGCTRQNIEYLSRTGKIHPIRATGKNTLYLKSEIMEQKWR